MAGLIFTTLDFEIVDVDNIKVIVFLDASTYGEAPNSPVLEITPPGSARYFIAQIQPSKVNVIDSGTIGMSQFYGAIEPMDFPDGVYTFSYKIAPCDYYCNSKYVLRTTTLDRAIQSIYTQIDVTCCSINEITTIKKELLEIYLYLESGKANAKLGLPDRASKDYSLAAKKVNRILDKLEHNGVFSVCSPENPIAKICI